jgi:hypothetical protein
MFRNRALKFLNNWRLFALVKRYLSQSENLATFLLDFAKSYGSLSHEGKSESRCPLTNKAVTNNERNEAMTRTKLGLLGLCAVVFGLMAFSATGAQAEGTWLILNAEGKVKTGVELPATLELEKDKSLEGLEHYILHTEILKIKVLFLCKEIKLDNAIIYGAGAIGQAVNEEKGSIVLFTKCVTLLNGAEAPECTPKDPTLGEGGISTKTGHALAVLHELTADKVKDDIINVLPDNESKEFAKIILPAACPIGTSVPVFGELALQDCEKMALVHLIKHLVEPFEPLTKLFVISNTAEHAATLLGSAWAKLGGLHAGLKWSISNL